jgi:hypothetical protein
LAVLKLAVLVSGVLALAKLGFLRGFLDFITGGFDTGRFGGLPFLVCVFIFNHKYVVSQSTVTLLVYLKHLCKVKSFR